MRLRFPKRSLPPAVEKAIAEARRTSRVKNKFHVAPKSERIYNGITFASKGEMRRHQELEVLQAAGKISNLERQVPIVLSRTADGKPLLTWVADWRYVENGVVTLDDFCGIVTPLKQTKVRMCAALYPEVTVRVSRIVGRGRDSTIVVTDCPGGKISKLPAKGRMRGWKP